MPKLLTDYSKTIIYKLVKNDDFNNENIYVGSTTDFTSRKYRHKNCCNNENSKKHNLKVYKTIRENGGWSEWSMIEIEKYPCNDKREAETRERYWYEFYNAKLNSNTMIITPEERKEKVKQYQLENADKIKQYRIDNAEELNKKSKQYYIDNADKKKQYYIKNADKIKQKLHKKYECDCGGKYTHQNKLQHFKSKKHQNYLNNKVKTI